MTEQPVVISDSDDGRDITAALIVFLGVPNTDVVFPVAFERFAAAIGPGLPDFLQEQESALFSRAGNLFWRLVNEVPDTPGEQSAIGHSLQVVGTDDQDYHWAEIVDAAARAAAQAAQDTGASNLQLIQALQSGKLDITDAFTQALADARYERIGQGGGAAVAPELVGFSDLALAADANEVALAVRTDVTRAGSIILSVSAGGVRLKAGSYQLTFMGDVDATGERFNPQFLVNDAIGAEGLTAANYYRATGGEQATIWITPLVVAQDTDFTFSARQGQYSSSAGVGGAGTVSDLRLLIQPVGGIKGDQGRQGDPGAAADVGADLPWKDVFLYPSAIAGDEASLTRNFYLVIEDKITTKTANRIELKFAGTRVLLLLQSDSNFSDLFGTLNSNPGGGAVFQFSLTESLRTAIASQFGNRYDIYIDLLITFTDGSTASDRLGLVADAARFPNPPAPGQFVPAGTLLEYGGSSVPAGYLDANGSTQRRAAYPALYAAIGDAYGRNDGSTNFRLPNPSEAIPGTRWIIKT